MSVDKLVGKIEQWGVDRNITADGGATVQAQFSKGLEEMAEGFSTLASREPNLDNLRDDIGDVVVCMIQAARLSGFTLEECLEQSWQDIKDRKGRMIGGKFVKED